MSNSVILSRATLADSDAMYELVCELKQVQFDKQTFHKGYATSLTDPNRYYQLARLNEQIVGMISLHMQFQLHHVKLIGEIQELVVMPQARGHGVGSQLLAWAEECAHAHGAELTELSTSVQRLNAHRFYLREGYQQSHYRFTKSLGNSHEPASHP